MRKLFLITLFATATASLALPRGLSGLDVGFGGLFGGGTQGFVQGEFDFSAPPYMSFGPEVFFIFGGAEAVAFGGEGRVYFIPTYNFIAQPFASFGGGVGIDFEGDTDVGGFLHFGGGMDIDVPNAPFAPYFDMGAAVSFTGDGSATAFKLEGGLRFDIW